LFAAMLCVASPASALVMRSDQGILTADDPAGAADVVAVSSPSPNTLRISDQAGMSPGTAASCVAETPQAVICNLMPFDPPPQVNLGFGDDELTVLNAPTFGVRISGEPGDDRLSGSPGGSMLGGAGNDRLTGLAGNDDLHGGAGNDLCVGGPGNDRCQGSKDADRCVMGGGKDQCFGNAGRDVCLGGAGRDFCSGGPGDDRCNGGGGRDTAADCERLRRTEQVVPK
jgi:hypothetical protein